MISFPLSCRLVYGSFLLLFSPYCFGWFFPCVILSQNTVMPSIELLLGILGKGKGFSLARSFSSSLYIMYLYFQTNQTWNVLSKSGWRVRINKFLFFSTGFDWEQRGGTRIAIDIDNNRTGVSEWFCDVLLSMYFFCWPNFVFLYLGIDFLWFSAVRCFFIFRVLVL